jgi:hypothetical protein
MRASRSPTLPLRARWRLVRVAVQQMCLASAADVCAARILLAAGLEALQPFITWVHLRCAWSDADRVVRV